MGCQGAQDLLRAQRMLYTELPEPLSSLSWTHPVNEVIHQVARICSSNAAKLQQTSAGSPASAPPWTPSHFHFGAITNYIAVVTLHLSVWTCFHFSWVDFAESCGKLMSDFIRKQCLYCFTFLATIHGGPLLYASLPTLVHCPFQFTAPWPLYFTAWRTLRVPQGRSRLSGLAMSQGLCNLADRTSCSTNH